MAGRSTTLDHKQDDATLARLAQTGDEEALSTLVTRHWDVVSAIAKSYRVWNLDFEDAQMIAVGAMIRAVQSWKPDGGANVLTWIRRKANQAMIDEFRKAGRKLEVPMSKRASLDDLVEDGSGEQVTLADAVASREDFRAGLDLSEVIEQILMAAWFPLEDLLNGHSEGDVSVRHGLSVEVLNTIVDQFRGFVSQRQPRTLIGQSAQDIVLSRLGSTDQFEFPLFEESADQLEVILFARDCYGDFKALKRSVMGELAAGYELSDIAIHLSLPLRSVVSIVNLTRAIASKTAPEICPA